MHRGTSALVAAAATLTACGSTGARPLGVAVTQTPAGAVTSATPATTATATATATPLPTAPLLIVEQPQPHPVVEAIDATGTPRWSFPLSSVIAGDSVNAVVGGDHLFVYGNQQVAVVDRSGAVVDRSTYSGLVFDLRPDPTGTRWAWSSLDEDGSQNGPYHGAVWVAGIGEAPHPIHEFTGDPAVETVFFWSDRGIVVADVPGGCGPYGQELSTALLDPATGRSTPLYGSDRHVTDVHDGLVAAITHSVAMVSGRATLRMQRPQSDGIFQNARISPDGAHVAASMVAAEGCGAPPRVHTWVGDVATARWTVLDGSFAEGWYDDSHLVVADSPYEGGLRVVDLQGHGGSASPLTHGDLLGVLG